MEILELDLNPIQTLNIPYAISKAGNAVRLCDLGEVDGEDIPNACVIAREHQYNIVHWEHSHEGTRFTFSQNSRVNSAGDSGQRGAITFPGRTLSIWIDKGGEPLAVETIEVAGNSAHEVWRWRSQLPANSWWIKPSEWSNVHSSSARMGTFLKLPWWGASLTLSRGTGAICTEGQTEPLIRGSQLGDLSRELLRFVSDTESGSQTPDGAVNTLFEEVGGFWESTLRGGSEVQVNDPKPFHLAYTTVGRD